MHVIPYLVGAVLLGALILGLASLLWPEIQDGRELPRWPFTASVLGIALIAFFGLVWHTTALSVFANREGTRHGLIARPEPNYIDFEYTANGSYYEFWAMKVPLCTTVGTALIVGVLLSRQLRKNGYRRSIIGLWGFLVLFLGSFGCFMFLQYLNAIAFFI